MSAPSNPIHRLVTELNSSRLVPCIKMSTVAFSVLLVTRLITSQIYSPESVKRAWGIERTLFSIKCSMFPSARCLLQTTCAGGLLSVTQVSFRGLPSTVKLLGDTVMIVFCGPTGRKQKKDKVNMLLKNDMYIFNSSFSTGVLHALQRKNE